LHSVTACRVAKIILLSFTFFYNVDKYREEDTIIRTVLEIINESGFEEIGETVSIIINGAMKVIKSYFENLAVAGLYRSTPYLYVLISF